MIRSLIILLLAAFSGMPAAVADDLLIDAGRRVEGLWVFPSLSDPLRYKYVPSGAQIVTSEAGEPEFGLTFYVSNRAAETAEGGNTANSIVQADGGAVLHFLVEYSTPPEIIEAAQARLRRDLDNEDVVLAGPVVFDEGQFSVISSILDGDDVRVPLLLTQRPAPLLEGSQVAISAQLPPDVANVLLGSLQTRTSDLSVTFDMSFSGLSQAYDATMIVDWEKTQEAMGFGAGVSIYFISAEVEMAIQKAVQDGAIRLDVNGDDSAMEGLMDLVYARALDLMFAPMTPEDVPEEERGGLVDSLMALLGSASGGSSGNTTGFGAYVNYRMKDLRSEGETRLSFNKRATIKRRAMLTMNVGSDVMAGGEASGAVRYVSTFDPADQLRRIFVAVDGDLAPEIGDFVNSVQVVLRKAHAGGRETLQELVVRPGDAEIESALGPLTYSNVERETGEGWLQYDYRTVWSFKGGGRYESPWTTTDAAMINLTAPFHRAQIMIEGESAPLAMNGVRVVMAEVRSDFFGESRTVRRTMRPGTSGPIGAEPIPLTLPQGVYGYDYTLTWMLDGGGRRTLAGRDDLGFLFVDEIPPADVSPGRVTEEE